MAIIIARIIIYYYAVAMPITVKVPTTLSFTLIDATDLYDTLLDRDDKKLLLTYVLKTRLT